jgi:HPt (histidine-containing phosphotransfer) domain-containing protein
MPTPAEDAFAAELADIRRSFIRSLEPRIVRLRELLPASANAYGTPEARAEIQSIAHKLAGSCASFGFQDIGDAAMMLEDKLIDDKDTPGVFFARDVEELIALCTLAGR